MAIRVICSSCLRDIKFDHNEAGLSRKCPGCGTEITVPGEITGAYSGRSSRSTHMLEFVIAGVILVAAVVGALLWLKSVQNRQTTRPITVGSPREPWASTPDTKPVVKPPKPVPINPISALLASHEALNLGPATVQIARIATATRSPILKTTPRSGNVFAIVGLELKSVEQGPAFDSYAVSLTPPGGTPCKVVVVTGVDKKGVPYEEPRQRLNSDEVPAGKVIKIELYFQIPESMDPGTCQLLYR